MSELHQCLLRAHIRERLGFKGKKPELTLVCKKATQAAAGATVDTVLLARIPETEELTP
jgi:hypothetical protein